MGKNKMDEVIKMINSGSDTGSGHMTKIELTEGFGHSDLLEDEVVLEHRRRFRYSRLLLVANVVVLETDNGYFILKTRYGKQQTRELMYSLKHFTVFSSEGDIEEYIGKNVLVKEGN